MNRSVDIMEVLRDMLGELAAWLKQPASNDLPDLLKALSREVERLTKRALDGVHIEPTAGG
jgi:hypothetical protein